jgi:mycothiol system anti-sigma-R factor
MSCGRPHDVDCAQAIEKVYVYLDGEMSDEDCAQLRTHIGECADCLREYGLEQAFKSLVARSCGCDSTPEDVRQRLLVRLREVRIELTQVEFRAE